MKNLFLDILGVFLLIFVFWPWALAAVDMLWYVLTGSQVSSFPWYSGRGLLATIWPFAASKIITLFDEY